LFRAECRRSRQGKKVADGRCGRTIEAQPVFDQTCHIEDVVAAPGLINPEGLRRWPACHRPFHPANGDAIWRLSCALCAPCTRLPGAIERIFRSANPPHMAGTDRVGSSETPSMKMLATFFSASCDAQLLPASLHPCRGSAKLPVSALCLGRRVEACHLPASQGGALSEPPGAVDTPSPGCKAEHGTGRISRWKRAAAKTERADAQQSERGRVQGKMKSIGEISIAPAEGRDFGNSRRAGSGNRAAAGGSA
jgi:hypothetical protein